MVSNRNYGNGANIILHNSFQYKIYSIFRTQALYSMASDEHFKSPTVAPMRGKIFSGQNIF